MVADWGFETCFVGYICLSPCNCDCDNVTEFEDDFLLSLKVLACCRHWSILPLSSVSNVGSRVTITNLTFVLSLGLLPKLLHGLLYPCQCCCASVMQRCATFVLDCGSLCIDVTLLLLMVSFIISTPGPSLFFCCWVKGRDEKAGRW